MKAVIFGLLLSVSISASALPMAKNISVKHPKNVVSVPGTISGKVNLAAVFEYSNHCVASNSEVASETKVDTESDQNFGPVVAVSTYEIFNQGLVCTTEYEPTMKWTVISENLDVGTQVVVNRISVTEVQKPQPAICIKSLCSNGEARDSFTCACSDGLVR